ncbi:MAG: hypothetical protein U0232_15445 [Thermomicrobiales bacterium]
MREAALDAAEGADMLMVGLLRRPLPRHHPPGPRPLRLLAAYQVSGEYAMLKAAVERGFRPTSAAPPRKPAAPPSAAPVPT